MPFIMTAIEHVPPCSIMHRFCIIMAAAWSSQVQVQAMPPCIFSIFILQRGTIIMEGIDWPMPIPGIEDIPMELIMPIPPIIVFIIPAGIIIIELIPSEAPDPIVFPRPVIVGVMVMFLSVSSVGWQRASLKTFPAGVGRGVTHRRDRAKQQQGSYPLCLRE